MAFSLHGICIAVGVGPPSLHAARRKLAHAHVDCAFCPVWLCMYLVGRARHSLPPLQAGIFEPSNKGQQMVMSLWGIVTFLFFGELTMTWLRVHEG